jgi:predicted glutamine amidotransferase
MCGITGFCLGSGKDRTEEDYSTIRKEFTRLLVDCQVRGVDAAGAFVVNKGLGNIYYYKAPKMASRLIKDQKFLALLDKIGPDTIAVVGHTRAATTGSPKDNDNNHPIIDDPIIGVHNGMIRNHLELGDLYPKVAEVDSAAIMALLRDSSIEEPLTTDDLVNRLPELEGGYAIAVVDARKPNGLFLARNHNPICMTRNYKLGYLAFASTGEILREALGPKIRTFMMPSNSVCHIDRNCMKRKIKFHTTFEEEEEWEELSPTPIAPPKKLKKKGSNIDTVSAGIGDDLVFLNPTRGRHGGEFLNKKEFEAFAVTMPLIVCNLGRKKGFEKAGAVERHKAGNFWALGTLVDFIFEGPENQEAFARQWEDIQSGKQINTGLNRYGPICHCSDGYGSFHRHQ